MAYVSTKDPVQTVPRTPKCARCRNHGFVVPLKGHSGKCQFLSCKCWKCSLITQRTTIMATQRQLKKSQRDDIAIKEGLAGFANQPSTASVNGFVSDKDTFPHATERRASNAGLMSDGDTCVPSGGSEDRTTSVDLEVAPVAVKDHLTKQIASVPGFGGVREGRSSNAIYEARDALAMNRTGSNAKVSYRIHVSAPQPIPPYYWPTGALAYPGDAVSNQDGGMPVFSPWSVPCPGLLEEVPVRWHLYFPQYRESGGVRLISGVQLDSDKLQDSQGSDIVSVDNYSSQDTA